MQTFKIYNHNHTEPVSVGEYKKWLDDNAPFYFVGPHVTKDSREIYTAYTANLEGAGASCFTTFEVFLDGRGKADKEVIYHSKDWVTARDLHKKLLKVKSEKGVRINVTMKAFS